MKHTLSLGNNGMGCGPINCGNREAEAWTMCRCIGLIPVSLGTSTTSKYSVEEPEDAK